MLGHAHEQLRRHLYRLDVLHGQRAAVEGKHHHFTRRTDAAYLVPVDGRQARRGQPLRLLTGPKSNQGRTVNRRDFRAGCVFSRQTMTFSHQNLWRTPDKIMAKMRQMAFWG
ncbi:Hypothetical protein OINT_2000150 [Brucella intermedia LMG 3301]|uniref:Uncharacterized protein n=1 Tax=Brucella intermedia LMG 3301 TaxID=641118 RepID=C4WLN8_9HYPH|nr:Hypothetical protein OINT_2000150 [Brucella intermedia LMG 3301]